MTHTNGNVVDATEGENIAVSCKEVRRHFIELTGTLEVVDADLFPRLFRHILSCPICRERHYEFEDSFLTNREKKMKQDQQPQQAR